jgi:very-short-patch-repair endonuclease
VEYDRLRTLYLQEQGWRVIRSWNDLVMNDMNGVILVITCELGGGGEESV